MLASCYEFLKSDACVDLLICKDIKEADRLVDIVKFANKKPYLLPDLRVNFGEDLRAYSEELSSLLVTLNSYHADKSERKILISPIRTALISWPTKSILQIKNLEFAQRINLKEFSNTLLQWGYIFVDIVETVGEVSIRGEIIDIFPPNSHEAIRIVLFDDTIESIRYFSTQTQKSNPLELERIQIYPALFSLNAKQWDNLESKIQTIQSDSFVKDARSLGLWALDDVKNYAKELKTYYCESMESLFDEIFLFANGFDLDFWKKVKIVPKAKEFSDVVCSNISEFITFHADKKITILARNEALLKQHEIATNSNIHYKQSDLIVFLKSKNEIILSLNKAIKKQKPKRVSLLLDELKIGDYVVHEQHGIGIFKSLGAISVLGATRDYVTIEYQGGDKLLIPVENLDVIDRYIGESGSLAILDKLGKGSFVKLKEKTRVKLFEIASEIVLLAAKREMIQGLKITPNEQILEKFVKESGFEYTQDQEKAINDIKNDFIHGRVMDRLLSGDVGFGKTEVAMYALLMCVKAKYQGLFIVPTMLLSLQHFKSLVQRLSGFGVKIVKLDGHTTAKEKTSILKGLENGDIDVCVGTHGLLNVKTKNLGLVVIDEEHKFGVKQKEKLKDLREHTHILSMSATPIPRSLNMALSSIKQYSTLLTPPSQRVHVRTFVKEYDDTLIKEVIRRELRRGGQVFYIHNRIASINQKSIELKKLVPDARILILHSEIPPKQSEEDMLKFEAKEYDVLLCTSIVESGIHLPNTNTIIIESADRFGMADLHQLRGRVGRSDKQGYCFFLVKDKNELSEQAKKRLLALESNTFLGSGSVLAYHDLEIRGGGNLIGEAQSGHIKQIGYALYLKLLEEAICSLTQQNIPKIQSIELKLAISAYLSDRTIPEDRIRLELYRRLSKCCSKFEVHEIEQEIYDRFGKPDIQSAQFLMLIIIKIMAIPLDIVSISNYSQNITIVFKNGEKETLQAYSKDDDDILKTIMEYLDRRSKK